MTVQELYVAIGNYLAHAPEAGNDPVVLVTDSEIVLIDGASAPIRSCDAAYADGPIFALSLEDSIR